MLRVAVILFTGLMLQAPHALTQNLKNQFQFNFSSGIEAGWWLYDKGSVDKEIDNTLGYDITHLAVILPVEFEAAYQWRKWRFGLGVSYRSLKDDVMRVSGLAINNPDRYVIAEEAVKILQYGVLVEYDLLKRKKFSLSPGIRFGGFSIDSIHPEADNFGMQSWWSFSVNHQVRIGKNAYWLIRPQYAINIIRPKTEMNFNEVHHIYGIGIISGIRVGIF